MPVLKFKPGRVEEVLGLPLGRALEIVERLKVEAELTPEGYVEMEIEVDRPDMYSLEGIARQVKGLLGRELGLPRYDVASSGLVVKVGDVVSRPYIAAAVVWDVHVDADYLEELIQFQEKLHVSIGGKRELVAIGLHDLERLPSKELHYKMVDIDELSFTPLGMNEPMKLSRVLTETEQGRLYGGISLRGRMHPALFSGDEVISVPPVINAELTKIEPGTKHIFVDVTGINRRLVDDTLSVIVANLAERSSTRKIGTVHIDAPWGTVEEPPLDPRRMTLSPGYVSKILGLGLDAAEVAAHLEKMRFSAEPTAGLVHVGIPRYRIDILHPIDLVEEVMLSIGVDSIVAQKPSLMMRGRLLPRRAWEREARKLLVGLGFVEVLSYSLVSCEEESRVTGIDPGSLVRLKNPIGVESSCLRSSLLPSMLEVIRENQHAVPVKVFELGEAYSVQGGKVAAAKRLAIAISDMKVGFENIQAVVYALLRRLGDAVASVESVVTPPFVEGRAARIVSLQGIKGVFGEVNPAILEELRIEYPVAVAELDYSGLSVPRP